MRVAGKDIAEMYEKTRRACFGAEVRRRPLRAGVETRQVGVAPHRDATFQARQLRRRLGLQQQPGAWLESVLHVLWRTKTTEMEIYNVSSYPELLRDNTLWGWDRPGEVLALQTGFGPGEVTYADPARTHFLCQPAVAAQLRRTQDSIKACGWDQVPSDEARMAMQAVWERHMDPRALAGLEVQIEANQNGNPLPGLKGRAERLHRVVFTGDAL